MKTAWNLFCVLVIVASFAAAYAGLVFIVVMYWRFAALWGPLF